MRKIWLFLKDEFGGGWTPFQAALLGVSLTLVLTLAILPPLAQGNPISDVAIISLFAASLSSIGMIQGARQKSSTFIFGIICSIIYAYLSFGPNKNLANGIYQGAIGTPLSFLGFYMWFKNRDSKGTVLPRSMSLQGMLTILAIYIATYLAYGFAVPMREGVLWYQHWVDSLVLVSLVIVTVVKLFRFLELWYMWLWVNLIQAVLYVTMIITLAGGNNPYGEGVTIFTCIIPIVNYLAAEVNAGYALYRWKKSYKTNPQAKYEIKVLTKDELKQMKVWPKFSYRMDKFFTKH